MCPEILNKKEYDLKADIWSLGVIQYQLLTNKYPFSGMDIVSKVNQGEYKIPKIIKISPECLDFLNGCLQKNVDKRLSHEQLLAHPYITNDNQELEFSLASQVDSLDPLFSWDEAFNDQNTYKINVNDSLLFKQLY